MPLSGCLSAFDPGTVELQGEPTPSADAGNNAGDVALEPDADVLPQPDSTLDDPVDDIACTDGQTWYVDRDGDGYGDPDGETTQHCDPAGGWSPNALDCDDGDSAVHPGATEAPGDGVDSDCNGLEICYVDLDGDGAHQGVTTESQRIACDGALEVGADAPGGDCDETDRHTYADAPELCDGKDNDCDGAVDEEVRDLTWYRDADGDDFGDASDTTESCSVPDGYVLNADDCDDTNPNLNPDADELCDEIDHDCDGDLGAGAVDASTWYRDQDGDRYGRDSDSVRACQMPDGYVAIGGDCDDQNVNAGPGVSETCDGADNDCDGAVDEGCDDDADGYCDQAMGYAGQPTACPLGEGDCDDDDRSFNPGATEICDGWDNDCNGLTDDDPADPTQWYIDVDGDGYGVETVPEVFACTAPPRHAPLVGDCDDLDPERNPGMTEVCNRRDDNCDEVVDEPGACPPEDCSNGIDDDLDYGTDCGDDECWTQGCQESIVVVASAALRSSKTAVYTPDGQLINQTSTCGAYTRDVAAHPAGDMIYEACRGDNEVRVRTIPDLSRVGSVTGINNVRSLLLHPNNAWLFVSGKEDVYWVDTENDVIRGELPFVGSNREGYGMSVSPDGTQLAIGTASAVLLVDITDIDQWAFVGAIPVADIAFDVAHRGDLVVAWSEVTDRFTVIDTSTLAVTATYGVNNDGWSSDINEYNLLLLSLHDGLFYTFTGDTFELVAFDADSLQHSVIQTPGQRPAALLPSLDHGELLVGPRAINDPFARVDLAAGTVTDVSFATGPFAPAHDIVAMIRVYHH